MKKLLAYIVLILMFPSVVFGAGYCGAWGKTGGGTSPWTVSSDVGGTASAAQADVLACVNTHATAEDTVNVTATGTVTWATENLDITQGVNLIGPGKDNLTIKAGFSCGTTTGREDACYLIVYAPSSPSSNHTFRLSGFTFDGDKKENLLRVYNSSTWAQGYKLTKVRIDNNSFINKYKTTATIIRGMVYGLMDNNYFNGSAVGYWQVIFDNGTNTEAQFEADSYTPSQVDTSEAFYFEDNTLAALVDEAFDMSYVGKAVIRYNDFASTGGGSWMEVHGSQCGGNWAMLGIEAYGNSFSGNRYLVGSRSGKHFFFYNELSSVGSIGMNVFHPMNAPDNPSGGNLCQGTYDSQSNYHYTADGYGNYPHGYFFINKGGGSESVASISNYDCCTGIGYGPWPDCCFRDEVGGEYTTGLTEGVDFYNYDASFDGTAGVGCGTLASRPATCTTGVAYWATEQSCSSISDYVGANPATKIEGTLYKCTSTDTWTNYYEPYDYPHPLRTEDIEPDLTAPVRSALSPTGQQACTTDPRNVTLSLTTDEAGTCKYGTVDAAYADLTGTFDGTGTTSHSKIISLACDAAYTYYVRCQDDEAAPNINSTSSTIIFSIATEAADSTAPTLSTQVLGTDGRTLTLTFDEAVKYGAGGSAGWTVATDAAEAITISYVSGATTAALVYTTSRVVLSTETLTLDYAQPTNGIEDITGNDFATIGAAVAITNNSTQTAVAAVTGGIKVFADDVDTGTAYGTDDAGVELGVRFTSTKNGIVRAIRFYKHATNDGTHVGNIWTEGGMNKGTVTFADETADGWQQQSFSTPVSITKDTYYVASYFAAGGFYNATLSYFASTGVTNDYLSFPAYSVNTPNGVYAYGTATKFPNLPSMSYRNYWVDIVFDLTTNHTVGTGAAAKVGTGAGIKVQ